LFATATAEYQRRKNNELAIRHLHMENSKAKNNELAIHHLHIENSRVKILPAK
jgi:hypothetical protein